MNKTLILLILASLSVQVSAEKFDEKYWHARALREAILQGNYHGYEDLIGILGYVGGEEAEKVLVELINYEMGEKPEDYLTSTITNRGVSILPELRSSLRKEIECQVQVRSFDKVKKLKCKDKKARDTMINSLIIEIDAGKSELDPIKRTHSSNEDGGVQWQGTRNHARRGFTQMILR